MRAIGIWISDITKIQNVLKAERFKEEEVWGRLEKDITAKLNNFLVISQKVQDY